MDWKQTTNSLSFIYKPSSEQHSTGYRLTRLNDAEFVVKIHTDNTVIRHDYDLSSAVSWPPTLTKRFESAEVIDDIILHDSETMYLSVVRCKCSEFLFFSSNYPSQNRRVNCGNRTAVEVSVSKRRATRERTGSTK